MSRILESFATTCNELSRELPKTGDRCFHIGSWGGCGGDCAALLDGECNEPQEQSFSEIERCHGAERVEELKKIYPLVKFKE